MVTNPLYISPGDYLQGEKVSPIKHEYRRGYVYAMVGAKKPHVLIKANITRLLGNFLEHTPSAVMVADIKVCLEVADCYYYPDVVVTCDPEDLAGEEDFIEHPTLIIEVLSKSTEKFDRGENFIDYQTCSTLQEYVLISQTRPEIEVRSLVNGVWQVNTFFDRDRVRFNSIDWEGDIADIYQKITFNS
jgi:Uma2 family endonuclease